MIMSIFAQNRSRARPSPTPIPTPMVSNKFFTHFPPEMYIKRKYSDCKQFYLNNKMLSLIGAMRDMKVSDIAVKYITRFELFKAHIFGFFLY